MDDDTVDENIEKKSHKKNQYFRDQTLSKNCPIKKRGKNAFSIVLLGHFLSSE